jgi:hypothetical protein
MKTPVRIPETGCIVRRNEAQHRFLKSCNRVAFALPISPSSARNRRVKLLERTGFEFGMVAIKRISIGLSLALYLVATTAVHALHNHATSECCCHGGHASCCADDGEDDAHDDAAAGLNGSTHGGQPSHPVDCEDSCFACRFLAAKSIAPVAVAIIERCEIVRPLDPPRPVLALAAQPDLPLSRGPPAV